MNKEPICYYMHATKQLVKGEYMYLNIKCYQKIYNEMFIKECGRYVKFSWISFYDVTTCSVGQWHQATQCTIRNKLYRMIYHVEINIQTKRGNYNTRHPKMVQIKRGDGFCWSVMFSHILTVWGSWAELGVGKVFHTVDSTFSQTCSIGHLHSILYSKKATMFYVKLLLLLFHFGDFRCTSLFIYECWLQLWNLNNFLCCHIQAGTK